MIDSCEIADLIAKNHADWLPRLLAMAHAKIGCHIWKGKWGGTPGNAEAEDFVSQAIEQTICGTRTFDPPGSVAIDEALFKHLDGAIDSLISHAWDSSENKKVRNILSEESSSTGDVSEVPVHWTPLDSIIEAEDEKRAQEALLGFIDFIDEDPQLKAAFELFLEGLKPEEVAKKLKLTSEQIYQVRRKLKRRISSYSSERKKTAITERGAQ